MVINEGVQVGGHVVAAQPGAVVPFDVGQWTATLDAWLADAPRPRRRCRQVLRSRELN